MPSSILVADDDPSILLTIRACLEGRGHAVETVNDGTKAMEELEVNSSKYSAVLADWEMPGATGIELIRWIRSRDDVGDIPVVMETALDDPAKVREGIEAGAYYYLTKPFDQTVLVSIVEAAIADFRTRRDLATKLQAFQNPFGNLVTGKFRFQTLPEGERLALWIGNASAAADRAMAVGEILTNAVEHGNLGIGYDEKSQLLNTGRWGAEVERRLALPEYASKFVEVTIERNGEGMTVVVEDEGKGFDHAKYRGFDEARVFDNHGRGIAMAGLAVGIEYLGRGNKVKVTIPAG